MGRWAKGKYKPRNPEKYIGNRVPTYRSSWELAMFNFCDNHPSVLQWASEAMQIPYKNPLTGRQSVYVPDILVVFQDKNGKQRVELLEIKPSSQITMEAAGKNAGNQSAVVINYAKWQAAAQFCRFRNMTFRVISEKDLFVKR